MSEQQTTCGQGLAERSVLPSRIAAVMAAMADVLNRHRESLDPSDSTGKAEDDAYATLVADLANVADALRATAERMAGYRNLPMAGHDVTVLMTAEATAGFERFVQAERELLLLLQGKVQRDEAMLGSMQEPDDDD